MNRRAQAGASLVAAVFLITALAALTAGILALTGQAQGTSVLALQQARVWQAAQAGAEWAAFTEVAAGPDGACSTAGGFTLTEGSLAGIGVTLTCAVLATVENGQNYEIYTLTSTASVGTYGGPGYAQRRVTRRIVVGP